jgi:hypothetical protein
MAVAWIAVSAALIAFLWFNAPAVYEASALLIVKPAPKISGERPSTGADEYERFLNTQLYIVGSPDVLADALAKHPELKAFDALRGAPDPVAALHHMVRAETPPKSDLIRVAIATRDPQDSMALVDAVAEAYLSATASKATQEARERIARLEAEANLLKKEIDRKHTYLKALAQRRGAIDPNALRDAGKVSMERFMSYLANWDAVRLERIRLESEYETARMRAGRVIGKPALPGEEATRRTFLTQPLVVGLTKEKARTQQQLEGAKRAAKNANDPALVEPQTRIKELNEKLDVLWKEVAPNLEGRRPELDDNEVLLDELEHRVSSAKATENALHDELKNLEIENKRSGSDALEVVLAKAELDRDEKLSMSIQDQIKQLEYDANSPGLVSRANRQTLVEKSVHRPLGLMAVMPLVALALVFPCFLLAARGAPRASQANRPSASAERSQSPEPPAATA